MEQESTTDQKDRVLLTASDLRQAASEGIISDPVAESLIRWAAERNIGTAPPAVAEQTKGFNLVTVAYYFGAMLMITACGWFLGDKWESLGSSGVLITTVIYLIIAVALGWWLRGKGYIVGGGLLISVAVCLVPIITFCIEDLLGFWPDKDPGKYKDYFPYIRGAWIIMELATMTAALVALWFVRFGFLTAPLAFSLWFFSMDVAAWIWGRESLSWNENAWISVASRVDNYARRIRSRTHTA